MRRTVGAADPELASRTALDSIASALSTIDSHLEQYVVTPTQAHLDNANGQADVIIAHLPALLPLTSAADVEGLRPGSREFSALSGAALGGTSKEEVRSLESQAQQLAGQLTTQTDKVDTQEARIDNVVAQFQARVLRRNLPNADRNSAPCWRPPAPRWRTRSQRQPS